MGGDNFVKNNPCPLKTTLSFRFAQLPSLVFCRIACLLPNEHTGHSQALYIPSHLYPERQEVRPHTSVTYRLITSIMCIKKGKAEAYGAIQTVKHELMHHNSGPEASSTQLPFHWEEETSCDLKEEHARAWRRKASTLQPYPFIPWHCLLGPHPLGSPAFQTWSPCTHFLSDVFQSHLFHCAPHTSFTHTHQAMRHLIILEDSSVRRLRDCSNSLNDRGFWADICSSQGTKEAEHGTEPEVMGMGRWLIVQVWRPHFHPRHPR